MRPGGWSGGRGAADASSPASGSKAKPQTTSRSASLHGLLGGVADELGADGAELGADGDGDGPRRARPRVYSPVAWTKTPGYGSSGSNSRRSRAWCSGRRPRAGCRGCWRRSGRRRPTGRLGGRGRSSGPSTRTRWGERLSTVNGPGTRTILRVLVRAVEEESRSRRGGRSRRRSPRGSCPRGCPGSGRSTSGSRAGRARRRSRGGCRPVGVESRRRAWPVSSASLRMPASASRRGGSTGTCAAIRRVRARASATRLVSIVIQRRPHCSAT